MSDRNWQENHQELDSVLANLTEIQEELNYKQAKVALQDLVAKLDLTPSELGGLQSYVRSLTNMLDKLEHSVVQIAAFGMVGKGKSSLLNALLGQQKFDTGPLHGVTQTTQTASWSVDVSSANTGGSQQVLQVSIPGLDNSEIQLVDTPGLDEVDGETREQLAREVATQVDLILFVISGDMTKIEYQALSQLREAAKPILLVFNQIDRYPETDRDAIYQKLRDERLKQLIHPDEIVMAAADPLVPYPVQHKDGSLGVKLQRGDPQVESLKLKILEVLNREGKSLVALNTTIYAQSINEKLVQRKMEIRDRTANQIVWNAVMVKSAAVAFNPVTVVDMIGAGIVDVSMILALSKLYGIPMTQMGALNLLKNIVWSMGGVGASELFAHLGLSGLKGLLGMAAGPTGGVSLVPYVSVALTQASVAGVASYAIGQIAKTYLAADASWGESGPKVVVLQILDSLDETSILHRVKDELRSQILKSPSHRPFQSHTQNWSHPHDEEDIDDEWDIEHL